MNKTQSGFALIESLLIILILVIIGFGGYYVWHTQQQTNKTLDTATATSQKVAATATNNDLSQKYLTIKEWGVRAPYTGSDTLSYHMVDGSNDSVELVSKNLSDGYGCTTSGAGGIARLKPSDNIFSITVEQDAVNNPDEYAHVDSYYYRFVHSQSACSEKIANTNDADGAQKAANQLSAALVSNLKASPK